MTKDNTGWIAMAALVLAVFAILIVLMKSGSQQIMIQQAESLNSLSVSGDSELNIRPDEAEIHVRVETEGDTALEAQEENRLLADRVMRSLKKNNVKEKDIETTQYRLQKIRNWNRKTSKYEDRGYKLYHVMKITTKELDSVGALIDSAVESGANGIDAVSFGLSEVSMNGARDQALKLAAKKAKAKADSIAESLEVSLGRPLSVSESRFSYVPVMRNYAMAESVSDGVASAPTEISPESASITATVSVNYLME